MYILVLRNILKYHEISLSALEYREVLQIIFKYLEVCVISSSILKYSANAEASIITKLSWNFLKYHAISLGSSEYIDIPWNIVEYVEIPMSYSEYLEIPWNAHESALEYPEVL